MSKSKQIVLAVVAVVVFSVLATSAMAYSGRIGDCVWEDANGDGIAQATEHGIDGVTVTMYRQKTDGTFSTNPFIIAGVPNPQTTRSAVPPATLPFPPTQVFTKPAADGWYSFPQALEGTYLVVVTGVPAGYVPTFDLDDGVLDGVNDTPNQAIVTLSVNDRLDVDFGYRVYKAPTFEVGDRVWHDINYNGVQDAGEEGINGATVTLLDETGNAVLDANGTPRTATTSTVNGVDGYYLFTGLLAGKYIVEVSGTPIGWACTYDLDSDKDSNSGIFGLTVNRYDVDFGYAEVPTTGFCTFTQGGWGAKPSGHNAGALLRDNWDKVYGSGGLTVGSSPYTLHFDSQAEVTAFLPQGGTAAPLTASYDPPTGKISVLAGQVVALRLNLDFSNAGVTQYGLGLRVIQYGTFDVTVAQFVLEAEKVLGGGTSSIYTINEINYIATQINESFDNGTTNTGFIK